mgnify:CR=1 FL=1
MIAHIRRAVARLVSQRVRELEGALWRARRDALAAEMRTDVAEAAQEEHAARAARFHRRAQAAESRAAQAERREAGLRREWKRQHEARLERARRRQERAKEPMETKVADVLGW